MGRRGPAAKDKTLRLCDYKAGVPAAPEWLCDEAKAEYDRITDILLASGDGLALVDMSVLAGYAQAYADVKRLTLVVRLQGDTVMSDKGSTYINPTVNVLSMAHARLMKYAGKLGFSPSDRSHITVPSNAKNPKANPLAALLGGGDDDHATLGPGY